MKERLPKTRSVSKTSSVSSIYMRTNFFWLTSYRYKCSEAELKIDLDKLLQDGHMENYVSAFSASVVLIAKKIVQLHMIWYDITTPVADFLPGTNDLPHAPMQTIYMTVLEFRSGYLLGTFRYFIIPFDLWFSHETIQKLIDHFYKGLLHVLITNICITSPSLIPTTWHEASAYLKISEFRDLVKDYRDTFLY